MLGYFYNFYKSAQDKRSPIGRKFAKSGHPGREQKNGFKLFLRVLFSLSDHHTGLLGFGLNDNCITKSRNGRQTFFAKKYVRNDIFCKYKIFRVGVSLLT
jgi:hypothetical protein